MNNILFFIREFRKGTKKFNSNISTVVNSVLLLLVYIISVGLTALVAKLVRKHFLELKLDKNKKSYWKDLKLKKKPTEEYYRQF